MIHDPDQRRRPRRAGTVSARRGGGAPVPPELDTPGSVLALQRSAGNAAVRQLLGADQAGAARARSALAAVSRPAAVTVQRCGDEPCDCPAEEQARASGSSPTVARSATATAGSAGPDTSGRDAAGRDAAGLADLRDALLGAHEVPASAPVPAPGLPVMRLTEAQFRARLGSTPEQKAAIDALFSNATFLALWDYLRACRATPAQDLGPLRLLVTPGLRIRGVERFGGYDPLTRTLEINPTKVEHTSNTAELVDTIVHELIHAVDDLQGDCRAAGSGPAPLAGGATAVAPGRASVAGTATEQRLNREQGPSASNPCDEFIDINSAAQRMIVTILVDDVQRAGVGRPTLTFVNEIIRREPAAMTHYEACRVAACRLSGRARRRSLSTCAADTIGRFIPADLTPALLPTRIHFDPQRQAIRADGAETLDMLAIFLKAHPTEKVNLVGHSAPVGSQASSVRFGQARAEKVKARLLAKGVDPAQIASVTSRGHLDRLSTSSADFWKDRRVEVTR